MMPVTIVTPISTHTSAPLRDSRGLGAGTASMLVAATRRPARRARRVYVRRLAVIFTLVSGESRFAPGRRVNVEIDGRQVAGVFVRSAAPGEGVNVKGAGGAAQTRGGAIGWVRRADTGEVEPFEYELISGA
jgi:hypothetical protein